MGAESATACRATFAKFGDTARCYQQSVNRAAVFAIASIAVAGACRTPKPIMTTCCQILELRQYTLKPGARDTLIELFDREFVETQEAEGMRIVGQFRDLDRPERFVWLRGFADMAVRARSLDRFYRGPTWKAHGKAANATMVDADDVLLLRPVRPFSLPASRDTGRPPRTLYATIVYLDRAPTDEILARFDAPALGVLTTEYSANTYPALPVRDGEHVVVVVADRPVAVPDVVVVKPTETLRLAPTMRSWLR
jgi:NIPSNAP